MMIRDSGQCARCGKPFAAADGDTHDGRKYGGSIRGLVHGNHFVCIRHLSERAEVAEKRAAELEAAQAWRPVTNDAPAPLERVVIDDPVDGLDVGWRLPEQPNIFLTRWGRSYLADDIRGWLSIPTTEPLT
jgi:hypothetical protein